MASIISIPSPDPSQLSDFKHTDIVKKTRLFSDYLSNLYCEDNEQTRVISNSLKQPATDIGFSHNKSQSVTSHELFLNSKLNQNYHLKHHQTHLKTVTKLNESLENSDNDDESLKQTTINSYLNDFNEFHRAQNINHQKRLSKYVGNEARNNSKELFGNIEDVKSKRFSITSLKNIAILSSRSSKVSQRKRGSIRGASALKKQISVKRTKSVSYKPVPNSKNIPLFKKKSTLFKVSNYAFSKTAYKDPDLTNEVYDIIAKERVHLVDKRSELSQALLKRISRNTYNRHSKIVNYSSNLDLRSKFDKELITKTEIEKLFQLWESYLTKLIALKIKNKLANPNVSNDEDKSDSDSVVDSILVNYQQSEFLHTNYEQSQMKTPGTTSNRSIKSNSNSAVKLSPLEKKINEYINKNRMHVSYATSMNNSEFSDAYIHDKAHDTIYTEYK
ncbi:hypothetical protein QEN19_004346 [Hanseniaspora menglaensis]